jgi:hypothetical protein
MALPQRNQEQHIARPDCDCEACTYDRAMGCTTPHSCAKLARRLLDELVPKWNPLQETDDSLAHSEAEQARNLINSKEGRPTLFDPVLVPLPMFGLVRFFAGTLPNREPNPRFSSCGCAELNRASRFSSPLSGSVKYPVRTPELHVISSYSAWLHPAACVLETS